MTEFKGACMGVRLEPRGTDDPHVMITVMIEDDGVWHDKLSISSYWLEELTEKLHDAYHHLENRYTAEPDPSGYGYRFKEKP